MQLMPGYRPVTQFAVAMVVPAQDNTPQIRIPCNHDVATIRCQKSATVLLCISGNPTLCNPRSDSPSRRIYNRSPTTARNSLSDGITEECKGEGLTYTSAKCVDSGSSSLSHRSRNRLMKSISRRILCGTALQAWCWCTFHVNM